jgi:hypothetical protein
VGIVVALLAFDLGVLHKDDKEIGVRESLPALRGLHQALRWRSVLGSGGTWVHRAAWITTPGS